MFKLYGRMLPALARALTQPRVHPDAPMSARMRVMPHDLDANLHLNNGRYLQWADVNRMEWVVRTGILRAVLKQGWKPVLGAATVQFRRELKLWDEAKVSTRLVGWDDRWIFLEHRIDNAEGRPAALVLARAGFRYGNGWVKTPDVFAVLPHELPPRQLPVHVATWCQMGDEIARAMGRRQLSQAVSWANAASQLQIGVDG